MKRAQIFITIVAGLGLVFLGIAIAGDLPHADSENVGCNGCHTMHSNLGDPQGPSLTKDTNANLCISCHNSAEKAKNWPFAGSDQADLTNSTGTSHRWDKDISTISPLLPGTDTNAPNNKHGLRPADEFSNAGLKTMMTKFSNVVTCSVCHQQHSQSRKPWPPYSGAQKLSGTATAAGTTTTFTDGNKTWTDNQWAGYSVKMTQGTAANIGQMRTIASNTANTITVSSALPAAVGQNSGYTIIYAGTATGGSTTTIQDTTKTWTSNQWVGFAVKMTSGPNNGHVSQVQSNTNTMLTAGPAFGAPVANGDTYALLDLRHFQRVDNDLNQLCEDCHYYRAAGTGTDVRTHDGKKKSHPVMRYFVTGGSGTQVADPTQYNTGAPLENNSNAQNTAGGSMRYHLNGTGDTNITNNIILDANGNVRCLSCHGMHYTDSSSATVDKP